MTDPLFVDCCAKQDIPEVEAVLGELLAKIRPLWRRRLRAAVEQAIGSLQELEDFTPTEGIDGLRKDNEKLLAALFYDTLLRAARQPLSTRAAVDVSQGAVELLRAGAGSTSLSLDLGQEPLLRQAARQDVANLLAARIELREPEIKNLATDFLTRRATRTAGIEDWVRAVAKEVGLDDVAQWTSLALDQWGYRWYVLGQFTAGLQNDLPVLKAVAVRDNRTTSFCLWVNGRAIAVPRARQQVQTHLRAALEGNQERMLQNWPMLPSQLIRSGEPADFQRAFVRVGLPPYHFRCRTTVAWSLT